MGLFLQLRLFQEEPVQLFLELRDSASTRVINGVVLDFRAESYPIAIGEQLIRSCHNGSHLNATGSDGDACDADAAGNTSAESCFAGVTMASQRK